MRVSVKFERDLNRAYEGDISLSAFIHEHKELLRGLARHALRYATTWYVSDEDDMYQEACCWLVHSLWRYDETRGRSLCDYVLYNIGARLSTQIRVERAARRHPDRNTARKIDIWGHRSEAPGQAYNGNEPGTMESVMPSPVCDPEYRIAIKQAFDSANVELSALAGELVVVLIEENGNLSASARRLIRRKHIQRRFGKDPKYLKYMLKKRVLPEIHSHFDLMAIMPVETGKPSNG